MVIRNSVHELSEKLLASYTVHNLTRITSTLIEIYKARNYETLKKIVNSITEYIGLKTNDHSANQNRYFSRLIILYHPDKINSYHKTISQAVQNNDGSALTPLSHIFVTTDLIVNYATSGSGKHNQSYTDDNYVPDPEIFADLNNFVFDLSELEEIDTNEPAYADYDELDDWEQPEIDHELDDFFTRDGNSFQDIANKMNIGRTNQLVLQNARLTTLDGIENFSSLTHLNLSKNLIHDIYLLCVLDKLEELDLADNQIFSVFPLCTLKNLRVLDLACNKIDDISDLDRLTRLEYVNLIGNPVPEYQINRLKKRVEIVLF